MELTVRILGPIELHLPNGVRQVRGRKPVSLLAILLSQANRSVSLDRLLGMLWDEDPPPSAVANIRTYVRLLRTALRGSPVRLDREHGGYLLRVTGSDCDHLRFAQLVVEGCTAADGAEPRRAIERLEQALALWRGVEAAEGVPRHGAVGGWLEALDEQRMRAVEKLAEARIAIGDPDRAVRELGELVAVAPLRSRGWWLKMLAHHRLGEHDRALAVYRAAAGVYRDELGIEPDPQLTELYRSLLTWDPAAVGVVPVRSSAGGTPGGAPAASPTPDRAAAGVGSSAGIGRRAGRPGGPLRVQAGPARPERRRIVHRTPEPPPLTGRDEVLTALRAAVLAPDPGRGTRVLVVHGPPGVGTSAVALRAAYDVAGAYPDGQLYLNLRAWPRTRRAVADPIRAVLRMLGVSGPPEDLHEAGEMLRAVSTGQRLLLVVDNVAGTAEVRPLLSLAGGCCVLLTCGYPLGAIPATGRFLLRPLTVPESVELLCGLLGPDRCGEELEHLAVLCGGLPLALRIVAARLIDQPALTAAMLIGRLRDDRRALDELETDDLSLRSCLREVLSGLGAEAQRAFGRFGGLGEIVLADAARRLGASEAAAEAVLDQLARAHLVVVIGPGRYRTPRFARLLADELRSGPRLPVLLSPSSA